MNVDFAQVEALVDTSGAAGVVLILIGDDGTFACSTGCSRYDLPALEMTLKKAGSAASRELEAGGYQCRAIDDPS